MLALVPLTLRAVQCIANGDDLVAHRGGDYGSADEGGVIHIRYSLSNSGYSPDMLRAVREAIQMWNNSSGQTNTVFDESPSPDFEFKSEEGGCGAWNGNTDGNGDRIQIPASTQSVAGSHFEVVRGIVAHEIGHILALGDAGLNPSPPSIMNNLGVAAGESCADAIRNRGLQTVVIQDGDAIAVNGCIGTARSDNYSSSTDQERDVASPECYDYYNVTRTYYCSGGSCTLINEDWQYLGQGCPYLN